MKKIKRAGGLTLSFLLLISTILSVFVIPLPIAKAAEFSWASFTVAESGDDVELLAYTGWSNYTTNGDNLWVHSDEYTTYAWLRFEGLNAITSIGVIDQIILSMYSGVDVGADYEEEPGGYVSVACPLYNWNWELTWENILSHDMNPVASFDGDNLSPSGVWYNKTISISDPREWYSWSTDFDDVFTCYVAGFMQYSPEWTYYRSFTSYDEGHPAKLYVKYHLGDVEDEPVDYLEIEGAYESVDNTWVYGDYFYVLNDTTIMKYYLENGLLTDSYQIIDYMTSVHTVLRKGYEVYIDMTYGGVRYYMCFDLRTFEEMNRTRRAKLSYSPEGYGVWNFVYYEFHGHGYWIYCKGYSTAYNYLTIHHNTFKMSFDEIAPYEAYGAMSLTGVGTARYMWQHYIYVYNTTSENTQYYHQDLVSAADAKGMYGYSGVFYNASTREWVNSTLHGGLVLPSNNIDYWVTTYGNNFNIQSELVFQDNGRMYTYATFGRYTIRGDDHIATTPNSIPYDTTKYYQLFWDLDSDNDEVITHYVGITVADPTTRFKRAYNREGDSMGGWSTFYVNYQPNLYWAIAAGNIDKIGQAAFGKYKTYTGYDNLYAGYVNYTNLVPIAERIVDASGNDIVSSFDYDDVVDCRIFNADLNLVATFIREDDTTLYVMRNLIDRAELASGGYKTPVLKFEEAILYEADGVTIKTDGWLFMGEVYVLTAEIQSMTTFYLELDDGVNTVRFNYVNSTKSVNIEAPEFVAGLVQGEVITINAAAEVYLIVWKFILNKNIVDVPVGQTITYYGENVPEDEYVSGTAITGLMIYNLGGHVTYDFEGDAGKRIGGDVLEIHHTDSTGNGAYVDVMFRKMQHVHLAFSLDVEDNDCFDVDENSGIVQFGFKYWNGAAWDTLYYAEMSIVNGAVDPVSGDGKAFIIPYVSWNSRQSNGVMTLMKSDVLSGYPECADDVNSQITYSKFYLDLWFNTMNSSTTVGGRISTKYFGMDESTSWFFWSNWKPVMVNQTESMFYDDLRDSEGDILQISDIELVKFYIRVLKAGPGAGSCDSHTWGIVDPEFSKTLAADRMQAINTPEGIDTLVLDMPSSGFLQPIAKAIAGIGNMIWAGALNFVKILIASMDTIFLWIGFPAGTFSQISNWVLTIPDFMIALIGYFGDILGNMITQVARLFTVIAVGVPQLIYGTGVLVTTITSYLNQIISLFTGGWSGVSDFWTGLELAQWIELFAVAVLPFMWLARLEGSRDAFKTAREDVGFVFRLLFVLIDLGSWLIQTIGTILQAIRNILPI